MTNKSTNVKKMDNNSNNKKDHNVIDNNKDTKKKTIKNDIKKKKVLDNKCPACGAVIKYNPTLGKWKCEYCNSEFSLEEMQKHNNASSIANNTSNEDLNSSKHEEYYDSYKCGNCGAEIVADEHTSATFCLYCGNTAILKNKLSGHFSPSRIIPFKTEKQQAIEAFKNLAKGRALVPKEFISEKNIENIRGIYIPFWLFDLKVSGSINSNANRIKTWAIGDTRFIKTSYYKLFRTATMEYKDIPVDASTRFANDIMNSLEPFNYNDMVPYNHAYLSGFFAEKYDVDSTSSIKEASDRALESAKDLIINDMNGYDSVTMYENTLSSNEMNHEYVLLPVWMVNVKYKDKMYLFAMNGQTGEFIGDIPIDKNKAILYGIITFIVTILIVIFIAFLMHKRGGI